MFEAVLSQLLNCENRNVSTYVFDEVVKRPIVGILVLRRADVLLVFFGGMETSNAFYALFPAVLRRTRALRDAQNVFWKADIPAG
jgi:hypothetical protein